MTTKYKLKINPFEPGLFKIEYDKELNPSQLGVVTGAEGPCLVLAGAGSGKTRTLIYRVAYLLEKGTHPEEILLVTFTNKAASEMRTRVETLLKAESRGLWCGTFHHIGNRVLRMYGSKIGLSDDFGILDQEDSRDLMKHCVKSCGLGATNLKFPKPAVVHSVLSFAANASRSVPSVIEKEYPHLIQFTEDFLKIQRMYTEKKAKTQNLDFDDLLLKWIELLKNCEPVREKLTRQFRYALVDEYQDTNALQQELMSILASHHNNLLVVGDDAQSIYSFRAAEIKNILEFPKRYESAKIFKLETNYRSSRQILDLANCSIQHNEHQFPKNLQSVRGDGSMPQVVRMRDMRQEAAFVAQRILELRESGFALSEIAVLFRAHYQAAEIELELTKRGIPYLVRGGIRFFEQAHIKDVLAYLRIVANPMDELAWARALTLEPGIGAGFAERIFSLIETAQGDLSKVIDPSFADSLPPKVRQGFGNFRLILKSLLKGGMTEHPDEMAEAVLEGGYNRYVLMNFENAQDRLQDLRELVNFAHTYKNLKDFLADATLREGFKGETIREGSTEEEASYEELVLSTIHQAKGLEWRAVFVVSLSEGQFPHAKSMVSEEELEEERRLFYVAVTRAKEELFMLHPMMRFDYQAGMVIQRPSVFIEELKHSLYEDVEIEESQDEPTIYLD